MAKLKRLTSTYEREIARYHRDTDWLFMERIQEVGKLWFSPWNKSRRESKPDELRCCLMTGMDRLDWVGRHKDWFKVGKWSDRRDARPIQLTDAGREALKNRHLYDQEPVYTGLVEPGVVAIPLPASKRQRQAKL